MCRIRCQFHFSLAPRVLQRWLRFINQPCMFSEVTKIYVSCCHWRVCFDGVKLESRANQYGNHGERSPSQLPRPEWLHSCHCAQPNPGLLHLSLGQASEPVALKSTGVTALICPRTARYAFPQIPLFKLLRIQRS